MSEPVLPEVPDVIPFEDEPGKQVLREWAEAYARACERWVYEENQARWKSAGGTYSLRYTAATEDQAMSDIKPFRPFPPLSYQPSCIITGCDLVQGDEALHGDLWELGDTYIFNAVGDFRSRQPSPRHISLFADNHLNYFERRNVFVFLKTSARLSFEAATYVAEGVRK